MGYFLYGVKVLTPLFNTPVFECLSLRHPSFLTTCCGYHLLCCSSFSPNVFQRCSILTILLLKHCDGVKEGLLGNPPLPSSHFHGLGCDPMSVNHQCQKGRVRVGNRKGTLVCRYQLIWDERVGPTGEHAGCKFFHQLC